MTVSYQYEVASSTSGGFTRLLFMWKGSLYKLIYKELFLFLIAFGCLSALYRNAFTIDQKRLFEKVVVYCDTFINLIPLSFVQGFYVAYVAGRWWQQFMAIPWPDKAMHSLALYIEGNDEHAVVVRRTLMRYLNLSLVLVLRSISSAVKRRFPTMDHLVEAGFMTRQEYEMFAAVPSLEFNTYWIPCTWFISHLKEARRTKLISDSQGLKLIMEEFNEFRSKCGLLWSYDWISIPLVYTQVVTIATYSFFIAAVVGRQYVHESKKQLQMEIDIYFPVFTILQFFFFMGLLKVAEQLINPFGDDDEDFELNWLIDRHTKVSYLGVDCLMKSAPPLVKDKYFDTIDLNLPYTGAAVGFKRKTYRGSVHNMWVPENQQAMFLPDITEEDEADSVMKDSPRNSFVNLFSGGSSASDSAGIWRQSVGSADFDNLAASEEGDMPFPDQSGPKIKQCRKTTRVPTPIVRDKVFTIPESIQWSSNSTIDSYCSTTNATTDKSGDITHEEVTIENESCLAKKQNIKVRSESSRKTISCLPNLNIRRNSNSSGQWKVVRWKPVISDTSGDIWSDNISLRKTVVQPPEVSKKTDNIPAQPIKCSTCYGEIKERRRNTDPWSRGRSQSWRTKAYHCGCPAYNDIRNGVFGQSLPNLQFSDYSLTDEGKDNKEN